MEIGAPIRTIVVEPLETPVPVPEPEPERAEEPEPVEEPGR